jgi:fumarylacetoacetase
MPSRGSAALNRTHDPSARSWVSSANAPGTDFPIQNLPFGVFRRIGTGEAPSGGVAIGSFALDVGACAEGGMFDGAALPAAAACASSSLNGLMALGQRHWSALRLRLHELLRSDHPDLHGHRSGIEQRLVPLEEIEMGVPAAIGDYTDFYASVVHATNVGRMLRPESPLLDNYKHVPVGYHGRASSVVVSGSPVHRPSGQSRPDGAERPVFGPSRRLDFEVEVGVFIGPGNPLGSPIPIGAVDEHIFGLCLVNDWSARDIQRWEYQPLGPFLAKSFATSVSPWVVSMEALEPFRRPAFVRPEGDPAPLAYLSSEEQVRIGGLDVVVEARILSARMREASVEPMLISRCSLGDLYWTVGQMVTHHASNGCNLRPGDLVATGTLSGPGPESKGCLLELTWGGTKPLGLPTGERRSFLEDGDEISLRARAAASGYVSIGFGECRGAVMSSTG